MPKRVQRQRTRGWRLPANTRIVDRTTAYGNPWIVRKRLDNEPTGTQKARWRYDVDNADNGHHERSCTTQEEAHALAVRLYQELTLPHRTEHEHLDLTPLRGLNLACWCPPHLDCHADILIREANQ